MKKDYEDDPQVIPFQSKVAAVSSDGTPTRDELVKMIRKVLSPAELFKLNAPKSRKKKGHVEVIQFILPEVKEKGNG